MINRDQYRGADLASAYGIVGAVAAVGAAVGPIVGGFFTTFIGWRWAFRTEVVIVFVVLLLVRYIAKDVLLERRPKFDFLGAILSIFGWSAIVLGIRLAQKYGFLLATTMTQETNASEVYSQEDKTLLIAAIEDGVQLVSNAEIDQALEVVGASPEKADNIRDDYLLAQDCIQSGDWIANLHRTSGTYVCSMAAQTKASRRRAGSRSCRWLGVRPERSLAFRPSGSLGCMKTHAIDASRFSGSTAQLEHTVIGPRGGHGGAHEVLAKPQRGPAVPASSRAQ